jgi:hypothetical protein
MRRILTHREQAELVSPWRTAFLPGADMGGDTLTTRVPQVPLDAPLQSHPAIDGFQEFLDSSLTPRDPAEALREYLMVWRPEDRINYDVLQEYVGQPVTDGFPYTAEDGKPLPSPREPYAVVTYPPGYEMDADDPRPGEYYARRRRRR